MAYLIVRVEQGAQAAEFIKRIEKISLDNYSRANHKGREEGAEVYQIQGAKINVEDIQKQIGSEFPNPGKNCPYYTVEYKS